MGRAKTKTDHLREMERLYLLRSYSDSEMAERLGVDRSSVFRYRRELESETPIVEEESGRFRIDRARHISAIRLSTTEALSMYLAARRASQQTRFAHSHTASALEKLAVTLRQPMTQRLVKAADRVLAQRSDPARAAVFETVARAWIENLQLRLDYRPLNADRARTHRFDPYLLEPSPWSDSVYLIGHSDLARRVITLKLERIERAVLSGPFQPPPEFDDEALLKHAWGIWGSDEPPVTVRLRFAPGVATRRLQESVWHPLERVSELPGGGCLWEAEIAEWREMLPWVRGWGADCEVLEPVEMREMMIGESRALFGLYGLAQNADGGNHGSSSTLDDFFGA
jgi:CRISPR-associated endonuclease/helicase Cas3